MKVVFDTNLINGRDARSTFGRKTAVDEFQNMLEVLLRKQLVQETRHGLPRPLVSLDVIGHLE